MSIDSNEIAKLAHLARISISEENAAATANSISEVLDLVGQLQSVDTDAVQPLAHPLDTAQRLRADDVTESNQREHLQTIAPSTEDGLYLVPRVIE